MRHAGGIRQLCLVTAVALCASFATFMAHPSRASEFILPWDQYEALQKVIWRVCPTCIPQGLSPCGTADIQPGKRFAKTLLQGKPKRGYLLTFLIGHAAFLDALRTPNRDDFLQTMAERFNAARLLVIEKDFSDARALPPPTDVVVQYSPSHHQCFGVDQKSVSCCLGDGGSDQTCPPKADSPRVVLTFDDSVAGESLEVVWAPISGVSKLFRKPVSGGRQTLYYCLTDDAGTLEGDFKSILTK